MSKAVLTIDDIASANTPAIVDYLCEKRIPVILFAVGENVEKHYQEALYALRKGMVIGNHSYSHPEFSSLSLREGIAEIEKNEALLDTLYADAGVPRLCRPFRFPYGDKGGANKEALQAYLKERGFDKVDDSRIKGAWYEAQDQYGDVDTLWTFDFGEWQIRKGAAFTAEDVLRRKRCLKRKAVISCFCTLMTKRRQRCRDITGSFWRRPWPAEWNLRRPASSDCRKGRNQKPCRGKPAGLSIV